MIILDNIKFEASESQHICRGQYFSGNTPPPQKIRNKQIMILIWIPNWGWSVGT
jgi:hypothetical protein